MPLCNDIIHIENLSLSYGSTCALDAINLSISDRTGGVIALLGANGAGKTSLFNCMNGLVKPDTGHLTLFGKPGGERRQRHRTGVMLQETDLPHRLTTREMIALHASYYPRPLSLSELVPLCGLDGIVSRRYGRLSGGQKRRVQLALAVLGRPELIFLDEPTTGLDIEARRAVWENIRRLADGGALVILSTHYLEEADKLADRVLVLDRGRLIADAPAQQLRATLGGSVISCRTDLSGDDLRCLPGVRVIAPAGRLQELGTTDAVLTLRALLQVDPGLQELTVRHASLEEAFLELTRSEESP